MANRKRKKPEQRNNPRYGVTLQLVYGVDDYLIEVLQSMVTGDRHAALKAAVYHVLDVPNPTAPPPVVETIAADVEQRLNGMQAQLDMLHMIQGNGGGNGAAGDLEQFRQELAEITDAYHQLSAAAENEANEANRTIERLTQQVDNLTRIVQQLSAALTNGANLPVPALDSEPEIDANTAALRAKRLKGKW